MKLIPELADVVIWTGQHYDEALKGAYSGQLEKCGEVREIHEWDKVSLKNMIIGCGELIYDVCPDIVTVYGDTSSTLAGALATANQHVKKILIHVEAGLRCGNELMPEERNRITVDHLADFNFCTSEAALHYTPSAYAVGDIMQERLCEIWESHFDKRMPTSNGDWIITVHRAENSEPAVMLNLLKTISFYVNNPKIFLHPKAKGLLSVCEKLKLEKVQGAIPYIEMLKNLWHCEGVITDSGGIMREAAWLGKKCIVLRNECEFPELVEDRRIKLVGQSEERFRDALESDWGCRVELENPHTTDRILGYLGIPKRREYAEVS